MTKWEYCQEHDYSGCALDVFCYCNVCAIYDTKWCPEYSDYRACAEGVKGTYISCIESCQAKREAGSDVSTCWNDCNTAFNDAIIECKQTPCHDFCIEKGYETGKWARYTQEYGWDSCLCENKVRDEVKPLEKMQIPEEYNEINETQPPTTTEEKGFFTRMRDSITNLFAKKEPVTTSTSAGRILALKNKKEIRVFRAKQNKWIPVGVDTPLFPGDMLKTGPTSRVKVELWLPKGESIRTDLLQNSIYEIEDKQAIGREGYTFSVLVGLVKVVYKRLTGQAPLRYYKTPTVVLGIRGTEFIMGYDNITNTDILMVKEGTVEANNLTIEAGQQINFKDGVAENIEPLNQEQYNTLTDITYDVNYTPYITYSVKLALAAILIICFIFVYKRTRKKKKHSK
jgi:hypothetical protein